MDNIQIVKQLLNGYHLSQSELKQARGLVKTLTLEIIKRCDGKHKNIKDLFECESCSIILEN
jgi:hypothetical protein